MDESRQNTLVQNDKLVVGEEIVNKRKIGIFGYASISKAQMESTPLLAIF